MTSTYIIHQHVPPVCIQTCQPFQSTFVFETDSTSLHSILNPAEEAKTLKKVQTHDSRRFRNPGDRRSFQEVGGRVLNVTHLDDQVVHGHVPGVEGGVGPRVLGTGCFVRS
jgi:hypothetical protein